MWTVGETSASKTGDTGITFRSPLSTDEDEINDPGGMILLGSSLSQVSVLNGRLNPTDDFNTERLVTALPGLPRYRVSAGTAWPSEGVADVSG